MAHAEIETSPLQIIHQQLDEAIAAPKCHQCGCLQQTVNALSATKAGTETPVSGKLAEARESFKPKRYECLGCEVCYPALAAEAFTEAFPETGGHLDLCPTEEPETRAGWPPLPGDYSVLRAHAPVAVCTLNSDGLSASLQKLAPGGLSITGTLHTENLGIERILRNIISNPDIRFLVLCGEDTQKAIGHLPGQSLQSLFENGIDGCGRIRGARGKRPVLKNVTSREIDAFRQQVELIPRIGENNLAAISDEVEHLNQRNPGPYPTPITPPATSTMHAEEPTKLTLDPAGYMVVYPDSRARRLVLEHYSNQGVLDCVLEGHTPAALYTTAMDRGLVTRLDHAAYLGKELARAEDSLLSGKPYVQDRAPGQPDPAPATHSCGCQGGCS